MRQIKRTLPRKGLDAMRLGTVFLLAVSGLVALVLVAQIPAPASASSIAVGLVTEGPTVEDAGWAWFSYQGLLRAETDMGVVGSVYTSTSSADYAPNLQQCVDDGNALCVSTGFGLKEATWNAAQGNPGADFAIVDVTWESYPANLRGMTFAIGEAAYLAGTLAGMMSDSDVIGSVGGMQIPPVDVFIYGYRNGARCANPDVTVVISYAWDFASFELGAEIAQDMMAQGADVIMGVGGNMGTGATMTATQSGAWGIGVDVDYYFTHYLSGTVDGSDMLLTSVMKRMDNAVYGTISDVVASTFVSGTLVYDLASDGVGLAPFHEADAAVSQDMRDALAQVKQGIIDGSVDIDDPCDPFRVFLPIVVRN
jgi:basic membrane protein A